MLCRAILSFDAGITNPVKGTAAAIEAIVGAGPASSLSALPLRRELLAIKAHAALGLEGVTALGQFAGMAT
jgi:hypothetical protein